MRFTKPSIAALVPPADKTDYIEWDDDLPGFCAATIKMREERQSG